MQELEDKYIELLLKRCLNFKKSKSLFISYDIVNKDFVSKVISKAKDMGITDIFTDVTDINLTVEKLKNIKLDDIEKDPYFNKNMWNEYALKDANFLMLETEFPHYMDEIDPIIITEAKKRNRKTREIFREKETSYEIPWCIAAVPNEIWAKEIFPNDSDSYNKLYKVILDVCMVNDKNPIDNWNNYLKKVDYFSNK